MVTKAKAKRKGAANGLKYLNPMYTPMITMQGIAYSLIFAAVSFSISATPLYFFQFRFPEPPLKFLNPVFKISISHFAEIIAAPSVLSSGINW